MTSRLNERGCSWQLALPEADFDMTLDLVIDLEFERNGVRDLKDLWDALDRMDTELWIYSEVYGRRD